MEVFYGGDGYAICCASGRLTWPEALKLLHSRADILKRKSSQLMSITGWAKCMQRQQEGEQSNAMNTAVLRNKSRPERWVDRYHHLVGGLELGNTHRWYGKIEVKCMERQMRRAGGWRLKLEDGCCQYVLYLVQLQTLFACTTFCL
jgi:hypothetical protein